MRFEEKKKWNNQFEVYLMINCNIFDYLKSFKEKYIYISFFELNYNILLSDFQIFFELKKIKRNRKQMNFSGQ